MQLKTEEEIKAYFQGKADGMRAYAWWKEGVQYVGTTGSTLAMAQVEVMAQMNKILNSFREGQEIWTG